MQRDLVSQEDLLKWLNLQMSKYDECTNCKFTSVQEHEEDQEGCNWSAHTLTCSGVPVEVCQTIANQIVAQAKGNFNVK